jgi:hypothetical protein
LRTACGQVNRTMAGTAEAITALKPGPCMCTNKEHTTKHCTLASCLQPAPAPAQGLRSHHHCAHGTMSKPVHCCTMHTTTIELTPVPRSTSHGTLGTVLAAPLLDPWHNRCRHVGCMVQCTCMPHGPSKPVQADQHDQCWHVGTSRTCHWAMHGPKRTAPHAQRPLNGQNPTSCSHGTPRADGHSWCVRSCHSDGGPTILMAIPLP